MSSPVFSRLGDSRVRLTPPSTGAFVAVGDAPRDITAMLRRERSQPDRVEPCVMCHDRDRTPINWWFAFVAAVLLGASFTAMFLVIWLIGRAFGLNPLS